MDKKRKELVKFINENINICGKDLKIDVLNQIASKYGTEVLFESGNGISIMFDELQYNFLEDIKKMVDEDLSKHLIDFSDLTYIVKQ